MILISVIVPVYNVEKYLDQCIQSVLPQLQEDSELILVDDGSTDQSGAICDRYAAQNDRIQVIHQQNGGLSFARNSGMARASGDYILFLDSDDFIESWTFEEIRKKLNSARPDIILCRGYYDYPDRKPIEITGPYDLEKITRLSGTSLTAYLCENFVSFFWAACAAVYRRDFLFSHQIHFQEGIVMEDMDWSFRLYPHVQKADVINSPYYHYRQARAGSIMATVKLKHLMDCFNVCASLADFYRAMKISESEKRIIIGKFGHLIVSHAQRIPALKSSTDRETAMNRIRDLKDIIFHSPHPRCRIFTWLWRIIGLRLTVELLNFRQKVKGISK